jgi:hypothetical protein
VTFYWEKPCKPNGIITGYIVSYNITTRTANLLCPVEEHDMTFNVTGNVTFLTTGRMIKWRLTVQQQSYRHCDSNENVDIKVYSFH